MSDEHEEDALCIIHDVLADGQPHISLPRVVEALRDVRAAERAAVLEEVREWMKGRLLEAEVDFDRIPEDEEQWRAESFAALNAIAKFVEAFDSHLLSPGFRYTDDQQVAREVAQDDRDHTSKVSE